MKVKFISGITICLFSFLLILFVNVGKSLSATASGGSAEPQYGGTLRVIMLGGPNVLGYPPELGPPDTMAGQFFSERLIEFDRNGKPIPVLAESWDIDTSNNILTWHLRKGVKFHDGTDFNAEAVKWNFQLLLDAGRIQYPDAIKSMDVLDDHTLRFNLNKYSTLMFMSWGYDLSFFSPTAIKANGKEWARTHAYGTGPFKIIDFKRDTHLKLEKFKDYWRPGRPYLDAVEIRYMPDRMTASASLQAGEADLLIQGPDINMGLELEKKGYKVYWEGVTDGNAFFMLPDSNNPGSIMANKKVREAIEHAIDREAMAKAFGHGGHARALNQLAPPGVAIQNPDYVGREYDLKKAKKLLKEAGYPKGFKTTIYTTAMFPNAMDAATFVQASLAAIGIEARIDAMDIGRYFHLRATGWKDGIVLGLLALDPNYNHVFVIHFGPLPTMVPMSLCVGRSTEYTDLANKVSQVTSIQEENKLLQQMVKQMADDAMVIPLFSTDAAIVMQNNYHFHYVGAFSWHLYDDWLGKK